VTTLLDPYIPAFATLGIGLLVFLGLGLIHSRVSLNEGKALLMQLVTGVAAVIVTLSFIIALPLSETLRGQILSLLGIVLTALIALSSTTFVANAMAGIMLQATKPFRPGDFIEVDGVFGRVTRRSLVHTRLQTETRDFTTLPNLLLVNRPVKVLHREGTIIQAEVSLGYDIDHANAEQQLILAATEAQLDEPYVLIVELLDHAVIYRVAGFLADFNNPISARSLLRREMLDALHRADIEITSPTVVAQRQQLGDTRTLPTYRRRSLTSSNEQDATPEQRIFDSADEAAAREQVKLDINALSEQINEQKALIKGSEKDQRGVQELRLAHLETRLDQLLALQGDDD